MKNSFITVIIPAAGAGSRMQSATRKQYLELHGQPILAHTLRAFETSAFINEIIVVGPEDSLPFIKEKIIGTYHFTKVKAVVKGGKERQDSVLNGLEHVSSRADIILVHDGVRPFIKEKQIQDICLMLQTKEAAVIAVPVKNTIKVVENGKVSHTPDRKTLWAIQTPQGMNAQLFRECYRKLRSENFIGTDEAMIAEKYNHPVHIIEGDYTNIKITTPDDLVVGELFLRT